MRIPGKHIAIALVLAGAGLFMLVMGAIGGASGATITVPDEYLTIQSAIDNATDYDTLFIRDGLYEEAVVVYRPLTIVGESQAGTVISNEDPFAVLIVAGKVSLSNVTVQMTTVGAGLILQGSYCVIEDVTVRDNLWGLWVNRGYHNVVKNVQCLDNDWQGVLVEEADHTLLEGVTCRGNNEGIHVRTAIDTTIRDCVMTGNRVHGLYADWLVGAYRSWGLTVTGCNISGNLASGCQVDDTDGVLIKDCNVENNAWSGIRAVRCNYTTVRDCTVRNYTRFGIGFVGGNVASNWSIDDNVVEDEGTSWSDVMVRDGHHCNVDFNRITCLSNALSIYSMRETRVEFNTLTSTNDNASYVSRGLVVGRASPGVGSTCEDVSVFDCTVRGFTEGIVCNSGRNVHIEHCTVSNCSGDGILLEALPGGDIPLDGGWIRFCELKGCGVKVQGMRDAWVAYNTIRRAGTGIVINGTLMSVDGNEFISNQIMHCSGYGVDFVFANGSNTFYLNNFINNTEHSSSPGAGDAFDNGTYGNYWDDYQERYPAATAVGRVWDMAYEVAMSMVLDRYPLAVAYDPAPPVADAGEDQRVLAGAEVLLHGGASTDNVGIVNYTWYYSVGDGIFWFHGEEVSLSLRGIGSYNITLEVRDAWGRNAKDAVLVEVYDDVDPEADAGEDLTVGMGELFTLDAIGSTDNGIIASYSWAVDPAGLDIRLSGVSMGLSLSTPGDYPVVLTVTDEAGNVATDGLTVHVLDTQSPVADAGADREYTYFEGATTTLDGSGSTDNVGLVAWTWSWTDGGEEVIIGSGVTVEYGFPVGVHVVTLLVSDAAGNNDTDSLRVKVNAHAPVPDTDPPVADAGEDVVAYEAETVLLDGTGSTDNVGIARARWHIAVGGKLSIVEGLTHSRKFQEAGVYEALLEVVDAAGNSGWDSVNITVLARDPERPWRLGPFKDDDGPLGGVRVKAVLNGTTHTGYTDDDGFVELMVAFADLVSPATVRAEKEGWKDLDLEVTLDSNGEATGSIPVMRRAAGDGGDDDEGLEEWLPWALVVVLVIAFAGTLLYLSSVARRSGEG